MKVFVLFALALELTTAFVILVPSKKVASRQQSFLKYAIVYPDDDEDGKKEDAVDPNSVAAAAMPSQGPTSEDQSQGSNAGPDSLDQYRDIDEFEADEVNKDLNVDAYDSAAGGIMSGFQLSSLCSDD